MVVFSWPWIFLLLPLPLLMRFLPQTRKASSAITVPKRVEYALNKASVKQPSSMYLRYSLLWLLWFTLLIAIAQPAVPSNKGVQIASGRTLTLAVDLSSSMERKDFFQNGKPIDRLSIVKQVASDFILKRQGDRVGLVLFSTESFVASPPTFDLASVAQALAASGTGMAGRTTAIGDALGMAIGNVRDDSAVRKAIILLSDGTNNAGSVEPESAARLARRLDITVHTIGLGSDPSQQNNGQSQFSITGGAADLDESTLKTIAELTDGKYFRATKSQELEEIYQAINKIEGAEGRPPPLVVHQPINLLFVILLLCLALLYHTLSTWRHLWR